MSCHVFSGKNVLGWNCHVKMQHIIQKSNEKHLMKNQKNCHSVFRYHKSSWQNTKIASAVQWICHIIPYTDCNMATDMLWSDKILATWEAYAWHLTQLICKLVAMLWSQITTLSCLQYGNRQGVFTFYLPQEYTIQVATDTFDVQISCHQVQLVAETAVTTN